MIALPHSGPRHDDMQHPWLSNLRNDVIGGLMSAAGAIPLAMGFGMFAFAVLGDQFVAIGALAGLYAAFIVAFACVLLGDKSATMFAPRINSTFFLGILLYNLVHSDYPFLKAGGPALTLTVLFIIVLLAGALQALFGAIRVGTLIKYVPQPVMAGFQNTAAILLFLVQIGSVFGLEEHTTILEALQSIDLVKPLSIGVAAVTILVMWNSPKVLPRVPAIIVGLAVGTALYYGLTLTGLADRLGPVIGEAPSSALPSPVIQDFVVFSQTSAFYHLLPTIIGASIALALISSLDALLCAKLITPPGGMKLNGDPLLMRLGAGNMVAACFGGITSGLSVGASEINRTFGGRTPVSVLVSAAAIFASVAVLFPILVQIPRVALAAAMMVIAIQQIDAWTIRHIGRVVSGSTHYRRNITLELLVMLVVAVLSLTIGIVVAVFVGVAIAVVLFILRMSRSVTRRTYRCDDIHSRKTRTSVEMNILEKDGAGILVMELHGVVFFGSAERLANAIAAAMEERDTRYVILDLRRVTDIDNSGSQILMEIHSDLAAQGKQLILSLARKSEASEQLTDFGVLDAVGESRIFPDIDRAIEWAEDDLLKSKSSVDTSEQEMPLQQISILADLAPDEIAAIAAHLLRTVYPAGSAIFREGDPGADMFIVVKGTASAHIRQDDGGDIRLGTFAPGTVFGELAILDRGKRSATVLADKELVCHVLSEGAFSALSAQAPAVAIRLLANLGRELSGRLRHANQTIHQLEM